MLFKKFLLFFFFFFFVFYLTTLLPFILLSRLHTSPLSHINEYHFIKLLGEGDQARVYKAEDPNKKLVAVKVFYTKSEMQQVHPEKKAHIDEVFTVDGSSNAAQAEVHIGSKLDHPN